MKSRYFRLPEINKDYINRQEYFFLFETGLCNKENFMTHIFVNPARVIKINRYEEVRKAFDKIEDYSHKYYLCGYFSYELGYYFEKGSFKLREGASYPLIYLCAFDKEISFNHKTGKLNSLIPGLFLEGGLAGGDFRIKDLKLNLGKRQYLEKVGRIKEYIRQGQTYQVNLTAKYHFNFSGSEFSLYCDLKKRQNVSFAAFCKLGREHIISLSPELYFRRSGFNIYSKPMKGTIARGRNILQDREMALRLKRSAKDLAENLMIVDLVRNDIGRICRVDSIRPFGLFEIERYNTLFQMTSGVSGILKRGTTYFDIFKSIFPGGSVTGAPKIRTMQIIKELETQKRKIYCGALGIISPGQRATFNLPIRTVSLLEGKGEMGVGSGVVIDSDAASEFQECILKGKFLSSREKSFELIETMLWDKGYKFFNEHLRRLRESAEYFDFCFEPSKVIPRLKKIESGFDGKINYKVRLLLNRAGALKITYSETAKDDLAAKGYVAISKYKTDPQHVFYYHKTTNRRLYDSEYRHYRQKGYFEVVFLNNRNEFTEGAISNIIVRIKRKHYTPPVSSGLLPGILRGHLIRTRKLEERVLTPSDLKKADKVFLCNSVRGLTEVRIKQTG